MTTTNPLFARTRRVLRLSSIFNPVREPLAHRLSSSLRMPTPCYRLPSASLACGKLVRGRTHPRVG